MKRIEKTVFISYRRTHAYCALAIVQYLTARGYDVFIDFQNIDSGDFTQIITENIKARAHFLVLLAPSVLDRCDNPSDWLRREMGIALDNQRNIVPIMLEGFDFGAPETKKFLTGKLERITKYNGLRLIAENFNSGMDQLCARFLNKPLDAVLHPPSRDTQKIIEEQRHVVAEEPPVDTNLLLAMGWFEKAYKIKDAKEKIRLYSRAIELNPEYVRAFNNRGLSYNELGFYKQAIEDLDQAIKLDSQNPEILNTRGVCYDNSGQHELAIEDYNQAIKLNQKDAMYFYNRGNSFAHLQKSKLAIEDYNQAISLNPEYSDAYGNRGIEYDKQGKHQLAIKNYNQVIRLNSKDVLAYYNRGISNLKLRKFYQAHKDFDQAIEMEPHKAGGYYNRACAYALEGMVIEATKWLRQAFIIDGEHYCELVSDDSDFDGIREEATFQELLSEFCEQC